jgi:molecular chaperone HtpG
MKEGQEPSTSSPPTAWPPPSSPQLEIFRKKGIEVLLLTDRVDEWMLSTCTSSRASPAVVAKGAVDLGKLLDEDEKQAAEQAAEAFKPVLEQLKEALKDRAKDVRVTTRLVDSPACIVVEEGDMSATWRACSSRPARALPRPCPRWR